MAEKELAYTIRRAAAKPAFEGELAGLWNAEPWRAAETAEIRHWHAQGSDHKPLAQCRALYDDEAIHLLWRVEDRYVRCLRTEYQAEVWKDSTVEFFFEPSPEVGYINLEMNCGGAYLIKYPPAAGSPPPPADAAPGFGRRLLDWELGRQVMVRTSLPSVVEPEITEPVTWFVQCRFPFEVIEAALGSLGPVAGQSWRGNFYKIAGENSHPHYGQWSPIGERLSFHQPQYFAPIHFE